MDITEAIATILSIDTEKGREIAQQLSLINSEGTTVSSTHESLRRLSESGMQADGLTKKRAEKLMAALTIGRAAYVRPYDYQFREIVVNEVSVAAEMLIPKLGYQSKEHAAVVVMDIRHKWIATKIVSVGTATECLFYPDEIFREAIKFGGKNIIVAHNHPSGGLSPSAQDLEVTTQIIKAGEILNIKVLDHLIVGNGDYTSLRQTTGLWDEPVQK